MYKKTTAVDKILSMKERLRIVQGGSSAGKTIAILLILIDIAQSEKNETISVVSESLPHLKRGAIKDFLNIMQEHNYFVDDRWNKTNFTYTFETGTVLEFFSADQPQKVKGPRRSYLFINECNGLSYETYTQLAIRTAKVIWLDFNPVNAFWVHEELLPKENRDFLIVTYKDNEFLPPSIIQELESRKENKQFWQVYGLGQVGEAEGRIYTNWKIIDELPFEARLERYGMDFGYTNDPTAIISVYRYNGGIILDELVYQKGLSNREIAEILKNQSEYALTVADSAEPKSIDEIRTYGVSIVPAKKGGDSIKQGIQLVQDNKISVTKQSVNLIKEYRNYLWETDRNGKQLNQPTAGNDHAMDAIRYALQSLNPNSEYTYTARETRNWSIR